MAKANAKAPVGQGGRFAAMEAKVGSPALAAYIGRQKYGAKKMGQMAAKGRQSQEQNLVHSVAKKMTKKKAAPAKKKAAPPQQGVPPWLQ